MTYNNDIIRLIPEKTWLDKERYVDGIEWNLQEIKVSEELINKNLFEEHGKSYRVYSFKLRRKAMWMTMYITLPCIIVTMLACFVFYLPADSCEKSTLAITVMLIITFFLTILPKVQPVSSMDMPLITKFLVFSLVITTLEQAVSVLSINWNYRHPSIYRIGHWKQKYFLDVLPKALSFDIPQLLNERKNESNVEYTLDSFWSGIVKAYASGNQIGLTSRRNKKDRSKTASPTKTCFNRFPYHINYYADSNQKQTQVQHEKDDWTYMGLVLDRFLMWVFVLGCVVGCVSIFLNYFNVDWLQ